MTSYAAVEEKRCSKTTKLSITPLLEVYALYAKLPVIEKYGQKYLEMDTEKS